MKIDILMATYNGERYIKEQIQSILKQTYSNFHLIIQDDYSKDSTAKIIQEFTDKRITFYQNKKNLGYIKNFESLVRKSTSQIIMLSDQDDFWLPEKIAVTWGYYQIKKVDLIYGDLIVTDENLNPHHNSFWKAEDIRPVRGNCWKSLSVYNVATGCTLLFNRKFIDKILPFPNQPIIHDWWISFIYAYFGKIDYITEKNILYRQHGYNNIGLTNDYYENTSTKIMNYISSTAKFMDHRDSILQRNQKISASLLRYCQNKFPNEKKLLTYLKRNEKYFTQIDNRNLMHFKNFRFKIYQSRGKIGWLVFIVLNFPIVLYIFHKWIKLFKRR